MKFFLISFVLLVVGQNTLLSDAARILAIVPFNAKSHFVMVEALLKGLTDRGHRVDVMGHFPLKQPHPNYTDVVSLAGTMPNLVNNMTLDFVASKSLRTPASFIAEVAGNAACNFLGHPKLQEIIKNPPTNPPYDLFITEIFGASCYLAVAHRLKVPVVALSTCVLFPWNNDPFGNPNNPALIPDPTLGLTEPMDFWQRLQNTVSVFHNKFTYNRLTSVQNDIVRKHIGPDVPDIRELERQIALVLVNSYHSLNTIRPMTPAVVEVGGLHVRDDGPELSPELKKWLDESKDGFVFVSFGSMMKIESFPDETVAAIYASLAKISPVRALMKIARPEELLPGLPGNVLTMPWIPQLKVLKHKNVRAFITHGGLMGTQEAILCGVPMIGVPLFGDQHLNIENYANKKIAVALPLSNITEKNLDAALDAVLNDPIYRDSAKKVSAQFLDRPLSAMDTAIFWVEYVLRNGGASLRSPALDLTWWQIELLDVYATLLFAASLLTYLAMMTVKILLRILFDRSNGKVSRSKKVE